MFFEILIEKLLSEGNLLLVVFGVMVNFVELLLALLIGRHETKLSSETRTFFVHSPSELTVTF